MTATEVHQRVRDVVAGEVDPPTDPAQLADLIDAASAMQAAHLADRLLLHFALDPDEADRVWVAACEIAMCRAGTDRLCPPEPEPSTEETR